MGITVTLPDLTGKECGDIAVTAAEGGIGYWAQIDRYDPDRWFSYQDMENIEVGDDFVFYRIAPTEDDGQSYDWDNAIPVTASFLRVGFERALNAQFWSVVRLLSMSREDWTGEIDSEAADVVVQFAAFGEVRYG